MTIDITPATAYRLWPATYDADPNPVLALEERVLASRVAIGSGDRILDLATGTGRWLTYARSQGARAFGVDLSAEMLAQAQRKGMTGWLVRGALSTLPFPDDFADLSICAFALGYLPSFDLVFREMARTSRRVIVSDLHPDALKAGWSRSFRIGADKYQVASFRHSRASIETAARDARLKPVWQIEARFGERERPIFQRSAKAAAFEAASRTPAVLACCWERG